VLDVQEGIEDAERGEVVDFDEVMAGLDEIITQVEVKRAPGCFRSARSATSSMHSWPIWPSAIPAPRLVSANVSPRPNGSLPTFR
jgi:hypothetical protein